MAKAGSKIEKVTGKKKVSKYSKELCISELARLSDVKNKDGVSVHVNDSKYAQDVKAQLATFK